MSELSEGAQSLVEQGRAGDAPSVRDKQRIRSRLTAELGAGAFVTAALSATLPAAGTGTAVAAGVSSSVGATTSGAATSSSLAGATSHAGSQAAARASGSSWWSQGLIKLLAAAGSAVALTFGVSSLRTQHDGPRASREEVASTPSVELKSAPVSPAPAASEQVAPAPSNALAAASDQAAHERALPLPSAASRKRAARSSAPAPVTRGASEADSKVSLSAELALLASAQRALREASPDEALRLANEHATRFAHGALVEERRGIEALAHCQRGERTDPSVRAFLTQSANSPLAARVRKQCGEP